MSQVAEAKAKFYATLQSNGVSAEDYVGSTQGLSILKCAAQVLCSGPLRKQAAGTPIMTLLMSLGRRLADPSDVVGATMGAGALGTIGGYTAGAGLAKLTSPTHMGISNLQKKELISEYDRAIQELTNRIQMKAIG